MKKGDNPYVDLIIDELNVKEVFFDSEQIEDVVLDTTITPELKAEGMFRDLVRAVQDLRKVKGLIVGEDAVLEVETSKDGRFFIIKNIFELFKMTNLVRIDYVDNIQGETKDLIIDNLKFKLKII